VWERRSYAERRGVEKCRRGERGEQKRANYCNLFFIFIFISSIIC